MVYSSAALHWVRDHESVLAGIARSLRPGGRCLLQMGGKGNGVGVIEAFENAGAVLAELPYAFFSAEEYRPKLEKAGLIADFVELNPQGHGAPEPRRFHRVDSYCVATLPSACFRRPPG